MPNNAHQPSSPTSTDPGACLGCGRDLYRDQVTTRSDGTTIYRDTVAESALCPAAEAARFDAEAVAARQSPHWIDETMRPGAYDPDDEVDGELVTQVDDAVVVLHGRTAGQPGVVTEVSPSGKTAMVLLSTTGELFRYRTTSLDNYGKA